MNVYVDDELVLTWSAQEGTPDFQEVPDIQGYSGQKIMFESAGDEGDWLAILEVNNNTHDPSDAQGV